ncbi:MULTISPECIES: hypothetical protein [Halomicrobium]|uniref:Uncharacterized protein n=1 Tax=Halomicrobium mukohataei TaxID=57705 RepID=A0A847UAA8_9EURY|nr:MULTISPECIES: hypothetical protein [Halomicrobium]NLV09456.1 hypothetical protein [Halomicrobium mukohataei]QGA81371.1 hypothetical protein LC1Hm_0305 [Halomicrobium sp. LC1Hm]
MASNPQSIASDEPHRRELPEEISADEHGTITLAFRDERVGDSDAFEMPERDD